MRAFCPAARAASPAKLLKFREIAFRACVMTAEGRKPRAKRFPRISPDAGPRPAPGKKRRHAASFDWPCAGRGPVGGRIFSVFSSG
jgi:hypothetical protein